MAAWIQLRGGRLTGSGGCTRIRGRYASMGGALTVNLAGPRKLTCVEQTNLVQQGLDEGLEAATGYELVAGGSTRDSRLLVSDVDGEVVLTFEVDDAMPLEPDEWRLQAYTSSGQRVAADATLPAVLTFQPRRSTGARRRSSGQVVGSTGCNGLVGDYVRRADVLSLGPLEVTDAPCSSAMAAQESVILGVLGATSLSLQVPPDRLILTANDDGDQLELSAAHSLEDHSWFLERIDYGAETL